MSTRSIIARTKGDSWEGRYHHWDGYPTGLGQTLVELSQPDGPWGGDLTAMLKVLIDDHPGGWSTINGADWAKEAGFFDDRAQPCTICGRAGSDHWSDELSHTPGGNGNLALGHFFKYPSRDEVPRGPECYCHGARHEDEDDLRTSRMIDTDCEWAYAINERTAKMYIYEHVYVDGGRLFEGRWKFRGEVDLREPEDATRMLGLISSSE